MYPVFDIHSFTLYIIRPYSINYVRRASRCRSYSRRELSKKHPAWFQPGHLLP